MAKKQRDKRIRKLMRMGVGSLGLTLPAEHLDGLGWRVKQKLEVKRIRGGFLVRDWRNK